MDIKQAILYPIYLESRINLMLIISGANGFVGQHLTCRIKKYFKSSEILCLVAKMINEKLLETEGLNIIKENNLKTLEVNLVTGKNLEKLPKKPELLIHLAANTDTSKEDHRANDVGTRNLLKALGPLDSKTHIIYTGTTVLYSGRRDCSKPLAESSKAATSNEYGRSKLRTEEFLKSEAVRQGFRLTVLKLNTIYGADPRTYKMFKVLKKSISKRSLTTRLNWPGKTAIIHVEDVVSAILKFAKKPPKPGKPETYILYSENLTTAEISKMMYEKMGVKYNPINLPEFVWKLCSYSRPFIPLFEKITPLPIYNLAWRFGLIVDDVIWCQTDKAFKALPDWKPRKFKDAVGDEV